MTDVKFDFVGYWVMPGDKQILGHFGMVQFEHNFKGIILGICFDRFGIAGIKGKINGSQIQFGKQYDLGHKVIEVIDGHRIVQPKEAIFYSGEIKGSPNPNLKHCLKRIPTYSGIYVTSQHQGFFEMQPAEDMRPVLHAELSRYVELFGGLEELSSA